MTGGGQRLVQDRPAAGWQVRSGTIRCCRPQPRQPLKRPQTVGAFVYGPILSDILRSVISQRLDTGPHSPGLGEVRGLINTIRIGQREALEFECDCTDHYGRRDRRAWFQIFGSYSDGVLTARCCDWTESAAGWICPAGKA